MDDGMAQLLILLRCHIALFDLQCHNQPQDLTRLYTSWVENYACNIKS